MQLLARKKRWLYSSLLLLAIFPAGACIFWKGQDRITRGNYDRIECGMTRDRVEAILGPPGDFATGPTTNAQIGRPSIGVILARGQGTSISEWTGDSAIIVVAWQSDRVSWCRCDDNQRSTLGPLDTLGWRLDRQMERWFPGTFD
jgi:hypothetical protein